MTLDRTPEALRGLAKVIRQHGTCAAMALETIADDIDAHIPQWSSDHKIGFAQGWNACRAKFLSTHLATGEKDGERDDA